MRGRALRTLAHCQSASAVELLEESARVLRDAPNRYELATTLAELGTVLDNTGRAGDARQILTEALTIADECDAVTLRTTLTHQLARSTTTPVRPRRINALSPTQRRLAQLAADGHSEADIAHAMVLDLDAVRVLIREIGDKLGTTSRVELRHALTHRP